MVMTQVWGVALENIMFEDHPASIEPLAMKLQIGKRSYVITGTPKGCTNILILQYVQSSLH